MRRDGGNLREREAWHLERPGRRFSSTSLNLSTRHPLKHPLVCTEANRVKVLLARQTKLPELARVFLLDTTNRADAF